MRLACVWDSHSHDYCNSLAHAGDGSEAGSVLPVSVQMYWEGLAPLAATSIAAAFIMAGGGVRGGQTGCLPRTM